MYLESYGILMYAPPLHGWNIADVTLISIQSIRCMYEVRRFIKDLAFLISYGLVCLHAW